MIVINIPFVAGEYIVNNEKTYQCEECGKTYDKRDSWRAHIRNTHGSHSKPIKCFVCEFVSSNVPSLRRHFYRYHHTQTDELTGKLNKILKKSYL
jgi:NAD-dependent SIR2 family protein deacetylase